MHIAVLGGGLSGLSAAYDLINKNHSVTIIEQAGECGGLARGVRLPSWDWYVDCAYHHVFSNDKDILNFGKETGFPDFLFFSPQTASLYENENNYRTFPVDTPHDFLRFPLLQMSEKIRAGIVVALLKISPHLPMYDKVTAVEFLKKTMGNRVWDIMWKEMFRKKFGKYAEKIMTAFIWSRINKRTKKLGYPEGGFQSFINHMVQLLQDKGASILINNSVESVVQKGEKYELVLKGNTETKKQSFDAVVSTLPTPVLARISKQLFSPLLIDSWNKIEYLTAVNYILPSSVPVLDKTYWLNVCVEKFPMMVLVQHTNLISAKYFNNSHLLYIANYVPNGHPLLQMGTDEAYQYYKKALFELRPDLKVNPEQALFFKAPFGQPIYNDIFIKNRPTMITPKKNFLIANLDLAYPFDRGTNYAVKLGRQAAKILLASK